MYLFGLLLSCITAALFTSPPAARLLRGAVTSPGRHSQQALLKYRKISAPWNSCVSSCVAPAVPIEVCGCSKGSPGRVTRSQICPLHRMQHRALQSPIWYREGLWGCVDALKKSFLIYTAVCKFLTVMPPVALQLWPAQRAGSWAAHLAHRSWCRYEGDVKGCFSLQQSQCSPVRAPLMARLSRDLPRAGMAPRSPMPGPCRRVTLASSLWSLHTFVCWDYPKNKIRSFIGLSTGLEINAWRRAYRTKTAEVN